MNRWTPGYALPMKKILFISFLVGFGFLCSGQEITLSLKLKKGETYQQLLISSGTVTQTVEDEKQSLIIGITGHISFLVKEIMDSVYLMEVMYKSLSMGIGLARGTQQFSSEKNDDQDVFSSLLAGMVNQPFRIKMTKKGDITEVSGLDTLVSGIFLKLPQVTEEQKLQIKDQFMKAYGEKAFKGNFKMMTAIFPDHPVSMGNKWDIHTQLELAMEASLSSTYEYMGDSGSVYRIHGNSKIETVNKDLYIQSNGVPLRYNLSGTMVSDISLDKESGWISEARISQEMSGDIEIKDNPKMPGGMIIPMTMKNKIEIHER
jgi:hypothetical protein